ncbi:hypothetical protein [Neobacillus fumarioli]|uniref:hypothetical protein n=1 Tax=Neobacillus fumarioli TaxID=105229 RepID=UPI000834191F|nr:hypothetical protein [Neobacillus fumarioli]
MNQSSPEKEMLLAALTGIVDQLEELGPVLETTFSDLRIQLYKEERYKIFETEEQLSIIEHKFDQRISLGNGKTA